MKPSLLRLGIVALALLAGQRPADGVTVTYLANEGVLLAAGNKKVLIDALFVRYRSYALPADSTRASLEAARAPFDSVNLILVTHHHGDHFHPSSVVAHMRANPGATLLTSRQVIDSARGRVSEGDPIASRLMARTLTPGMRRRETVDGIDVELLGLPHGGGRGIEHLGYVVELGGRRILQVGDTDDLEKTFASFRLDTARIDVALLPQWIVTSAEGKRVIERWIRPKQVVAIHLADGDARAAREVQAAIPGAIAFNRSLDTRRW